MTQLRFLLYTIRFIHQPHLQLCDQGTAGSVQCGGLGGSCAGATGGACYPFDAWGGPTETSYGYACQLIDKYLYVNYFEYAFAFSVRHLFYRLICNIGVHILTCCRHPAALGRGAMLDS